jgi:hypothetical protein
MSAVGTFFKPGAKFGKRNMRVATGVQDMCLINYINRQNVMENFLIKNKFRNVLV